MEYEYVAVSMRDIEHRAVRAMLIREGWEEHLQVPWHGGRQLSKGICIMRRPKDEPRMWTEAEIREIAKDIKGSVLNERAMQADLCGRLERRNAELQGRLSEQEEVIRGLQAAIDEVVAIARHPAPYKIWLNHYDEIRAAIRKYLSPLVPKEGSCPDYRPDATATE